MHSLAVDTGLEHRPVDDGQRVSGVYRRSVMLASGCFAMLDDREGFSLAPWKPLLEQRLGQSVTAVVRVKRLAEYVAGILGQDVVFLPNRDRYF